MSFEIRKAQSEDVEDILFFIKELADYEKLSHEVQADVNSLKETLFGENPVAHVLFAVSEGQKVGMALYFYNYSTFLAQKGIYLEDLFVLKEHRGQGFGKALLQKLAEICVKENGGRLEWSVLDWNTPSIEFYDSLKAQPMKEWITYRLTDTPLKDLSSV